MDKQRQDGRTALQIRNVIWERDVLLAPQGSVRVTQGKTTVFAAVHGPKKQTNPSSFDKCCVQVSIKHFSSVELKHVEYRVKHVAESIIAHESIPGTSLNLSIQIMDDDGSALSVCLNAMCFAFLDACIPIKSLVSCVAVARVDSTLFADPSLYEQQTIAHGNMTAAFVSNHRSPENAKPIFVSTEGKWTREQYESSLQAGKELSLLVRMSMRQAVVPKSS